MENTRRATLLLGLLATAAAPGGPRAGDPADIAPWGEVTGWADGAPETAGRIAAARDRAGSWLPVREPRGGEIHLGVAFDEPRAVQAVRIVSAAPIRKVQYWRQHWPNDARGGWAPVDDDYHGRWEEIPGKPIRDGEAVRIDCPPFDAARPWRYRVTRKVRVVFDEVAPVRRIEVLSTARWREVTARVERRGPVERVEVRNGHLLERTDEKEALRLRVLATDADDSSTERTLLTLTGDDGFTVSLPGLLAPPAASGKSFYQRVPDEPEQTYARAAREIPALDRTKQSSFGLYLPLGVPHHRQEIAVRYTGDFLIDASALKSPGPDGARLAGARTQLRLPTGDPPDHRERRDGPGATVQSRLDGRLPVVITRWEKDGIELEETAFATLSTADPERTLRGDEPMVLLARVRATNRGREPRQTTQRITFEPAVEGLRLDGEWLGPGRLALVRGGRWTAEGAALAWPIALRPGQSASFEIRWPFGAPASDAEAKGVAALDFDRALARVAALWRRVEARGAAWQIPEPLVQDLWRANLPHVLITADRDVASGHLVFPAGTFKYNVCANEAIHQLRALDLRGQHEEARRGYQAFLAAQGSRAYHGRYRTREGLLHGLSFAPGVDYQTFNYNLDHGFVLWGLVEHYRLTGDRDWLRKQATRLVAAADFVTRERRQTMAPGAWHHGLLPEGHLEDPPEFHHWYAVNAYAYRGLRDVAAALAEVDHPEAARLRADAEAFHGDLTRALTESRRRAPLVRLRDGRQIPFFPTRCHLRGRDSGWIRDALYGPIHLVDCGVFAPRSREADWILEDAEDNVFVSESHGRKLRSEADWFSWGGITIQANLLPNPLVYLARDEPLHAIRAFYNALASHIYPDVRVFTEHPVQAYGLGAGPFFKTPDESAWVTWLRHLLLREDGNTLWIAPATPRGWLAAGKRIAVQGSPTYFGPVSFTLEPAREGLRAVIDPPRRAPCDIVLRLRHPEGKRFREVRVDGRVWKEVDGARELVRLGRRTGRVEVVASY